MPRFLLPAAANKIGSPRKALFLDRDGIINVDFGYVCSPERTVWVPGIFDLCVRATRKGYALVVATNQAGIARGYYTVQEFIAFTAWMHEEFDRRGTPLLATYYCPHHPVEGLEHYRQECECRKPAPGLILEAAKDLDIDLAHSILVGDKSSDIAAAEAAGVRVGIYVSGANLTDAVKAITELT